MSDEKLRELERRFRETGSADDEVAWLRERARAGEKLNWDSYSRLHELDVEAAADYLRWRVEIGDLSPEDLRLAAVARHEAALRASPKEDAAYAYTASAIEQIAMALGTHCLAAFSEERPSDKRLERVWKELESGNKNELDPAMLARTFDISSSLSSNRRYGPDTRAYHAAFFVQGLVASTGAARQSLPNCINALLQSAAEVLGPQESRTLLCRHLLG